MILLVHCFFRFSFKCKVISNTWDLFQVTFPNILKFIRNTLLHNLYLHVTLFSAFGNVAKPSLSCSFKMLHAHVVTLNTYLKSSWRDSTMYCTCVPRHFPLFFFFQARISVENDVWKSLSFYRLPWVWYAVVEWNVCQLHNFLLLAFGLTQYSETG